MKTQLELLVDVAQYIVDGSSNECNDYIDWCGAENLNPKDLYGEMQSRHVYAKALMALKMEFPTELLSYEEKERLLNR